MVGNVEPLLEERPRSAPSSWLYQAPGGARCPDLETTSGAMSDVLYKSKWEGDIGDGVQRIRGVFSMNLFRYYFSSDYI